MVRIELTTGGLQNRCSAAELHRLVSREATLLHAEIIQLLFFNVKRFFVLALHACFPPQAWGEPPRLPISMDKYLIGRMGQWAE